MSKRIYGRSVLNRFMRGESFVAIAAHYNVPPLVIEAIMRRYLTRPKKRLRAGGVS